jgi:hypothetical protein
VRAENGGRSVMLAARAVLTGVGVWERCATAVFG